MLDCFFPWQRIVKTSQTGSKSQIAIAWRLWVSSFRCGIYHTNVSCEICMNSLSLTSPAKLQFSVCKIILKPEELFTRLQIWTSLSNLFAVHISCICFLVVIKVMILCDHKTSCWFHLFSLIISFVCTTQLFKVLMKVRQFCTQINTTWSFKRPAGYMICEFFNLWLYDTFFEDNQSYPKLDCPRKSKVQLES